RAEGFDAIDTGRLLTPVILGDLADSQAPGRPRGQQETLQSVDDFPVAAQRCSVDPPLERVDISLDLGPGDVPPFLYSRCRWTHDVASFGASTFYSPVAPSAYPPAFPGALASGPIPPPAPMRLAGCSFVERGSGGYFVPDGRLA